MKSEFGRGLLLGVIFMAILGGISYGAYRLVDSMKTTLQTVADGLAKPADTEPSELHGSFCGKSQHEVAKLIAGPSVYICDECVGLCNDILAEDEMLPNQSIADPEALP